MTTFARIALALLLSLAAPLSYAKLLTWYLQDVTATNGDAIRGFFQFDPTTGVRPPVWDVASRSIASSWNGQNPFSVAYFNPGETGINLSNNDFTNDFQGTEVAFRFIFKGTLPAGGGTVPIASGNEFACNSSGSCPFHPEIVSGSVTTIPEPASCVFVAIALAALALLVYSRRPSQLRQGAAPRYR